MLVAVNPFRDLPVYSKVAQIIVGGWDSMVFFHATIPMAVLREENLMRYLGATSTMEAWL